MLKCRIRSMLFAANIATEQEVIVAAIKIVLLIFAPGVQKCGAARPKTWVRERDLQGRSSRPEPRGSKLAGKVTNFKNSITSCGIASSTRVFWMTSTKPGKKILVSWPRKDNHFCVIPNDCHREAGLFEQMKTFLCALLYDFTQTPGRSGSATVLFWQDVGLLSCFFSLRHFAHMSRDSIKTCCDSIH